MIQVLVADDHAIVRDGLSKILEFEKDMVVLEMAANASEVIHSVSTRKVDVLVLDISMPGRSGLDIIRDVKSIQPGLKIIMLSMFHEERYAVRAFKAGASGYLTKEMATEEIVNAIRKVHTGGKYISARFAETLVSELSSPSDVQPHERLSDREFEVMCMIASGKSISEISRELCLSDHTVSTYRRRILDTMNLKSNADLIYYAIENGFWV